MVEPKDLADRLVRRFVEAVNAGDRDAFFALLTDDATMSDDGSERNLEEWVDRELFSANGRMEVESQSDDGRSLIVDVTNSTYGTMRTTWKFTIEGDKVARFETGQAPAG
jgi:hypothetical protein